MKANLGEKVFWTLVALSSIGAAAFGYHRFKLIRPDLFGQKQAVSIPENERAARIAEYQQKGDALTRAASREVREPRPGESCQDGFIVTWQKPIRDSDYRAPVRMVENGQPVRCDAH